MRVCGGRGLMRAHVREKINKIVIYTFTVTVQICTVTVANVYIYTTIVGLMLNKFRIYYVNFVFFILHNFTPINVSALRKLFNMAILMCLLQGTKIEIRKIEIRPSVVRVNGNIMVQH